MAEVTGYKFAAKIQFAQNLNRINTPLFTAGNCIATATG
jgi:hypothetical protein